MNKKELSNKIMLQMKKEFLHWASYNPTLVKQDYNVSTVYLQDFVARM